MSLAKQWSSQHRRISIYLLAMVVAGCANVGRFPATTSSHTELSKANFRVIEGNVRGNDTGFAILGLIPIVSPSYGDAMSNLRSKVPVTGKSAALANVTQDRSTLYLILFSLPSVTVTADIIEFLPERDVQSSSGLRHRPDAAALADGPPADEAEAVRDSVGEDSGE